MLRGIVKRILFSNPVSLLGHENALCKEAGLCVLRLSQTNRIFFGLWKVNIDYISARYVRNQVLLALVSDFNAVEIRKSAGRLNHK